MPTKTISAIALAAFLACGTAATSAPEPPLDVTAVAKARHEHFHDIGRAMKAIFEEAKKPSPDIAVFKTNGKTLADLSAQLPSWFPAGTGPDKAPKTRALPAIWTQPAEFKKDAADFNAAAKAFSAAADSGRVDATLAAFKPLGDTCGACHKAFRSKEDHD